MCLWKSNICSWMFQKQTSVSHSSTESEKSLDAGLRMDGLLALDSWHVGIEVLRSSSSAKPPTNPAAGNCVGLWENRAQQLVLRDLWREIRSEPTKQVSGRAVR